MVINFWICWRRSLPIHRIHCQCSPSIVVTSKIPISGGGEKRRAEGGEDHVSSEDDDGAHATAADGAIETEIEKKRLLPFQTAASLHLPL